MYTLGELNKSFDTQLTGIVNKYIQMVWNNGCLIKNQAAILLFVFFDSSIKQMFINV